MTAVRSPGRIPPPRVKLCPTLGKRMRRWSYGSPQRSVLRGAWQIQIRTASGLDAKAASALVSASFNELAAADWEPHARDAFLAEAEPKALAGKIERCAYCAAALADETMLGFLLMPTPALLGMLFVHPDWLRRGVGGELWETARQYVEGNQKSVRTVELNATPYAVPFYLSLGSCPSRKSSNRPDAARRGWPAGYRHVHWKQA